MPADNTCEDPFVRAVTERLAREFAGSVAREDLEVTVHAARRDLEGQIVPEALAEMLHQLARHRLRRVSSSPRPDSLPGRALAQVGSSPIKER